MSYSLNEVEGMARRAARGAGYSWGMAEETGKAIRWLCANGLDGCGVLVRLFEQTQTADKCGLSPQSLTAEWISTSGRLCPLTAGASLSDCAGRLKDGDIVMHDVINPILVLPFAAAAAIISQKPVALTWDGHTVICNTSGTRGAVADCAVTGSSTAQLRVSASTRASDGPAIPLATRASPDAADWATLDRFAQRTYAPATEASRLLGAGTGLSDND